MNDLTESLADHAKTNALLKFSVDRDSTDSYRLQIEHYAASVGGLASELKSQDLMNLLPTGSSFRKLIGWRSIFGSQFLCGGVSVTVIGIEQIYAHPTRGAYPCSHVYMYPNLKIAADGLSSLLSKLPAPASDAYWRDLVYSCTSVTPEMHLVHEASTIACTVRYWQANTRFLFRTLLIDESTLRLPGHPGPFFKKVSTRGGEYQCQNWLICTIPIIRDELSMLTRAWMNINPSASVDY